MRSLLREPFHTPRLNIARTRSALMAVLIALIGVVMASPAPAQALIPGSSQVQDAFLNATGQPGPHRIEGHYFTSPVPPAEQNRIRPQALIGPSTPVFIGQNVCTIAISGIDAQGNKIAITAGHCGNPGDPVLSLDAGEAGKIGTYVRAGYPDYGVIKLRNDVRLSRTYGRVSIAQLGGAIPGTWQPACKTGISTGTSCGPVLAISGPYILAHICGSFGDSGGPLYAGNRLIGIVNGGIANLPSCTTPLQGPFHSPTAGAAWTVIQADLNSQPGPGAGFRLP